MGRYVQCNVNSRYRSLLLLQEQQNKDYKISLGKTRVMIAKWISKIWVELITNHKHLIKSSWKHTGLHLSGDGADDNTFLENIQNK